MYWVQTVDITVYKASTILAVKAFIFLGQYLSASFAFWDSRILYEQRKPPWKILTNLGIFIWYPSFVGGKDVFVMIDCTSADDTPFLPVMDAKLGNHFLAIASAATLFSPLIFFVRLGLLSAPSEVNVQPPESSAKGSVTGSFEVSVSCLNHSSAKSNTFLVADSTEFFHI